MTLPKQVLIGGNHLANALIGLGYVPNIKEDIALEYRDILALHGELVADIWVCWKAIMLSRDEVEV